MKPFNIKLIAFAGLISANLAGQQIKLSAETGNTKSNQPNWPRLNSFCLIDEIKISLKNQFGFLSINYHHI